MMLLAGILILLIVIVILLDKWHTRMWERSMWDAYGNGPRPPEVEHVIDDGNHYFKQVERKVRGDSPK